MDAPVTEQLTLNHGVTESAPKCAVDSLALHSGLSHLHAGERLYLVLCGQGEFIGVPANVSRWFESEIARRSPDFNQFVSQR